MKPKILLSCALIAFFLGLGLLIAGWNGTASVNLAWPISSSLVKLSGSAAGWRPMAGIAGLLLAIVLFLWALISLVTRPLRRKQAPEVEPQPDAELKKQAASQ